MSYIYAIINLIDCKIYFGSTSHLKKRLDKHLYLLRSNTHVNLHLQRAWNKYKEENFSIQIIEEVENIENLITRERFYIECFDTTNPTFGYNIQIPLSVEGASIVNEETKAKISKTLKDKNHRPSKRCTELSVLAKAKKTELVDPKGNIHQVNNMTLFCKNNNLNYKAMMKMLSGKSQTSQGWHSLNRDLTKRTVLPVTWILRKGDEVVETTNLECFCRSRNLSRYSLLRVVDGVLPNYEGWTGEKFINNTKVVPAWENKNKYLILSPCGETYITENLREFSKSKDLPYFKLVQVSRGSISNIKGWKCSQILE